VNRDNGENPSRKLFKAELMLPEQELHSISACEKLKLRVSG
jgi:hypothetical protein